VETIRSGLIMRLSRTVRLAPILLLALAAGCGGDDGFSVLAPEKGLVGMWVRYQPAPLGFVRAMLPQPIHDTLFIANDLGGLWSREVMLSNGIEPLRSTETVKVEPHGTTLILYTFDQPCPACMSAELARLSSLAVKARFRMQRTDGDHLVIMPFSQPDGGAERYFYVRRPVPRTVEE
jgi:hypothetical protein